MNVPRGDDIHAQLSRIAAWLEASADTLTPDEARMVAEHIRATLSGRELVVPDFLRNRSSAPASRIVMPGGERN